VAFARQALDVAELMKVAESSSIVMHFEDHD
jgi:hypothetical protein